eukprot:g15399.t1
MSWQVIPQLKESRLELVSDLRRTGAFPVQLQLLWAPRVGAERWTLEVLQPEFDFTGAVIASFLEVDPALDGGGLPLEHGELVVEQLGSCGGLATMRADRRYILLLDHVQLPSTAAIVRFQAPTSPCGRLDGRDGDGRPTMHRSPPCMPQICMRIGAQLRVCLQTVAGQLLHVAAEGVQLQAMSLSEAEVSACLRPPAEVGEGLAAELLCELKSSDVWSLEVQGFFPAELSTGDDGVMQAWRIEVQDATAMDWP